MMAELEIGKVNVTSLLKEKYKKLGKGWITLMEVPTQEAINICSESLRILINENRYNCIYITLNKQYNELDNIFRGSLKIKS